MGWVTTSSCCSPAGREVHVKRPARLTALAAPRDRTGLTRLVARGRVPVGHLVAVAAHHFGPTGELLAVGAVRGGDPVVRADDHRGPGQAFEDLREGNVPAIVPRAHQHPRRGPTWTTGTSDTNSRLIMPPMAVVERASFVTRLTGGRSNGCETELDNSLSCFALNAETALAAAGGRQPAPGTCLAVDPCSVRTLSPDEFFNIEHRGGGGGVMKPWSSSVCSMAPGFSAPVDSHKGSRLEP